MKFGKIIGAMLLVVIVALPSIAQTKMSKEEWQKQIAAYTAQRDSLQKLLAALKSDIENLKATLASLDQKIKETKAATEAMTGATAESRKVFEDQLAYLEKWANELSRLANQDLYARRREVDSLQAGIDALKKSKLAALSEYYPRLQTLQQITDNLKAALAKPELLASLEKTYTVGTWVRNRDCLWNISKKKDIYDNPFMWPKIWQGNREQIKDPDIIKQGQKLRIPMAGPMNDDEKRAERQYWRKKQQLRQIAKQG